MANNTKKGVSEVKKVDPLLSASRGESENRRSSDMTDEDIYAGYGDKGSKSFRGVPKNTIDEDEAARNKAMGNSKGEFGDFADEDDENPSGCCLCYTEEEVEVEWRTVALRFGTNTSPAPQQRGSVKNAVFTGKYTLWSFLPKGIFEQFRRVANVYFLIISILMAVGTYVAGTWYSSLDPWTTIGPLMLIVGLTLMKEGLEDSKRHKADHAVNTRKAKVLCFDGSTSEVAWSGLQPGMVVLIEDRGEFPADLVPLVSSEEEGKCYIETANIDGETNLKLRTAAMGVNGFKNVEELLEHKVSLSFEPPSASIHSFSATLDAGKKGKAALGPVELLLRGAVLRNSKWIMGVIVYTGFETKLVMNSREAPSKLSTVEQMVNQMIYCILGAMLVLTSLTTLGYYVWNLDHDEELWYLCRNMRQDGISELFLSLCEKGSWSEYPIASLWPTFFILYNNFLPISLYVTVELVNVAQAYFIDQDINIYHKEQDTPALARTSNMNGDLGQIEYVFSDKTGTLTCNEMKFRRFCVGTKVFGAPLIELSTPTEWLTIEQGKQLVAEDPVVNHFAQLLSTCHNVVVEDGKYMAESPDEEALVDGGASLGLKYTGQTGDKLSVLVDGTTKTFTLLATVPFDSARKRMSVLVKDSEGACWLYCKGADNVMFDRTADNGFDVHCGGKANLDKQLEVFAAEGLRTLVLGYRKLSSGESSKWCSLWKQATEAVADREGQMAAVAAKLELDLILLGCTGIEDRLQDGVPDTIANIKKAGIKVWVLTGDKMTTAIEIGLSCKLLTKDLDLIMLEKDPPVDSPHHGKSVTERLVTACRTFLTVDGKAGNSRQGLGLVVDGPSLTDILANEDLKQHLLELACSCVAVVACRVSPAQKQLIVKMVKDGLPHKPITLSIGDGANDVPMIQEAQIGVGISGKEGRQAVNSSDFAIAQFRFLETLLLVHGRWNYRRISKVIVYSFYKNIVLTIVLAWWTNDCGYSGQSLYESYVYSGYNFFLGLPILLLGIFDQDVTVSVARKFHKLYYIGLEKRELNVTVMVMAFLQACADAAVIYYLSVGAFNGPTLAGDTGAGISASSPPQSVWGTSGESLGLYVFGTAVFTNMVMAMLMKVALMHSSWNWTTVFGLVFSVALYTGFVALYGSFRPDLEDFAGTYMASYDFYAAPQKMADSAGFWMSVLLVPTAVFAIDLMVVAIQSEFFTSKTRSAREVEAFKSHLLEDEEVDLDATPSQNSSQNKSNTTGFRTPAEVEMSKKKTNSFVIDEI